MSFSKRDTWKKWSWTLQLDILFKHMKNNGDIPTSISNPTDAILRRKSHGVEGSPEQVAAIFNSAVMKYPSRGKDVAMGFGSGMTHGNNGTGRKTTGLDSSTNCPDWDSFNVLSFDDYDSERPTTVSIV